MEGEDYARFVGLPCYAHRNEEKDRWEARLGGFSMSFLRIIAAAVLALITAGLTFLGIITLGLLAFPAQMEHEISIQSIPFAQWTLRELNLVLGVIGLIFIAVFLAAFAAALVWRFVGGSQ